MTQKLTSVLSAKADLAYDSLPLCGIVVLLMLLNKLQMLCHDDDALSDTIALHETRSTLSWVTELVEG